jgi:transposase
VITRAGDEALRRCAGGRVHFGDPTRAAQRQASPWLAALLKRMSPKLAAVALANKTARIAWKMMVTGDAYSAKSAVAA